MDDKSFNIRVPKRWVRVALIVGVTALIVAPLTAIASHSFTDVPDSNTFHEDIAWLADAGVTKGCNPPANTEFCPGDDVTRGQMSAFMRRFAQFIGAEDGTPAQADNADTVDGQHASAFLGVNAKAADSDKLDGQDSIFYQRPIAMKTGSLFDSSDMTSQNGEIARVAIESPASGSVILEHTSSWAESGTYVVVVWVEPFNSGSVCDSRLDGDAIAGTWSAESVETGVDDVASLSGAGHVSVGSGTTSYSLCLDTFEGTSNNVDWSIEAAWYPGAAADTSSAVATDKPELPNEGVLAP